LDRMSVQAVAFGAAELSRAADVVNSSLTEMTGATSPRLHLELMVARLLVPAADDTDRGALARVERLERRMNIADPGQTATSVPVVAARSEPSIPRETVPQPSRPIANRVDPAPESVSPEVPSAAAESTPESPATSVTTPEKQAKTPENVIVSPSAPVTLSQLKDAWPEILEVVQRAKRTAWMVVYTATPRVLDGDVLTLSFPSETDVTNFKDRPMSGDSVSETLRSAINTVLGIRVKYVARVDTAAAHAPVAPPAAAPAPSSNGGWNVAVIPGAEQAAVAPVELAREPVAEEVPPADEPEPPFEPPAEEPEPIVDAATPASPASSATVPPTASRAPRKVSSAPAPTAPRRGQPQASARYGEAVVRELLGASFIEEQSLAPRDSPVPFDPSNPPSAPGSAE
jgi:DNA polymerase-3 subunit gamma/tau